MSNRFLSTLLLLFVCAAGYGQSVWLWPIEGQTAGENILYVPQQYIDKEHNFDSLFLGGEEGDRIVAPADAAVVWLSFCYCHSQTYMSSFDTPDEQRPIGEQLEQLAAEADRRRYDPDYITAHCSLQLSDGRKIHLAGFRPARYFKSGERIERGTLLGTLHRSYHKIRRPSLCVSVSEKNGTPADPMTSFGLRSTFLPPQRQAVKERLTAEEARRDFAHILAVLREAYPSLGDAVAPERLAAFERAVNDSLANGIRRDDFYHYMLKLQALVHDSHFVLHRTDDRGSGKMPQLFFGWYGDSCVVTMTQHPYASYVGRRIAKIGDMTTDSARHNRTALIGCYDAGVRSVVEERLASQMTMVEDDEMTQRIEFADGERRTFRGSRITGHPSNFTQTYLDYYRQNIHLPDYYEARMIDDSTAYLGITTFELNEVTVDRIVGFIDSLASVRTPNLVVDLRNNGGGDIRVLDRLLACLLEAPARNKGAMQWVSKRGHFASFDSCCLNYGPDMEIFGEYEPMPDGNGFFSTADSERVEPDSLVQYRGRLYVLTNAGSYSASTCFPAAIVRNRRGVVVGRETGTAYHYMTALKSASIRLPNSGFQFSVPLVRLVYDTTRNERIPYGRGVLPDYPVDLTRRELFEAPDSILQYALRLIAEGRYLEGDDPFAANDAEPRARRKMLPLSLLLLLFGMGTAVALTRKRRS